MEELEKLKKRIDKLEEEHNKLIDILIEYSCYLVVDTEISDDFTRDLFKLETLNEVT